MFDRAKSGVWFYTVGAIPPGFDIHAVLGAVEALRTTKAGKSSRHRFWLLSCINAVIVEGMDGKKDPLGNGIFRTMILFRLRDDHSQHARLVE